MERLQNTARSRDDAECERLFGCYGEYQRIAAEQEYSREGWYAAASFLAHALSESGCPEGCGCPETERARIFAAKALDITVHLMNGHKGTMAERCPECPSTLPG
jgi:hypothetical protein